MKPDVSVNNLLVRLEGDVPDDHVVQQDPQAPDCCLVAVVLVAPLLIQKRTTVADEVPDAVAPLVEAKRHMI